MNCRRQTFRFTRRNGLKKAKLAIFPGKRMFFREKKRVSFNRASWVPFRGSGREIVGGGTADKTDPRSRSFRNRFSAVSGPGGTFGKASEETGRVICLPRPGWRTLRSFRSRIRGIRTVRNEAPFRRGRNARGSGSPPAIRPCRPAASGRRPGICFP